MAANSQQALAELQQHQASAAKPADILNAQRQQQGVNSAQDTVTGLRSAIQSTTKLLNQVAPSVMGRTGNSLVTSAQANRITQNEQAPIAASLEKQGTDYGYAGEDLSRASQRASEGAALEYQGQQDRASYLQNLYNALYGAEKDARDAAEARRQFDAQIAEAARGRASSGGGGGGGFSLSGGATAAPASAPKAPATPKEAAYLSVQHYLQQGKQRAQSDYHATAKSAAKGNQVDMYKLLLYNQAGIWK